jgi:hypothetical protein
MMCSRNRAIGFDSLVSMFCVTAKNRTPSDVSSPSLTENTHPPMCSAVAAKPEPSCATQYHAPRITQHHRLEFGGPTRAFMNLNYAGAGWPYDLGSGHKKRRCRPQQRRQRIRLEKTDRSILTAGYRRKVQENPRPMVSSTGVGVMEPPGRPAAGAVPILSGSPPICIYNSRNNEKSLLAVIVLCVAGLCSAAAAYCGSRCQ